MPDQRRLYLTHSNLAISPGQRLAVAGILRDETVQDLQPDALINRLLPHDADIIVERTEPDLILIESRALIAGGPWAGTAEPSASAKAPGLLRILDVALGIGRPTVLWWNDERRATPGLIPFESRFDFVLGGRPGGRSDMPWSPGVQLSRFGTVAVDTDRRSRPVLHARWDRYPLRGPRTELEGAVGALTDDCPEFWLDADLTDDPVWLPRACRPVTVVRVEAAQLPFLYKRHAHYLADRITPSGNQGGIAQSVLRQLAAGGRVVSGPDAILRATFGRWIRWARNSSDVADSIRAMREQGPRTPTEQRALLRRLFRDLDTTHAVTALSDLVGSPRATPRREVCAVAQLDDGLAQRFVDAIIVQDLRPTEALIATADETVAGPVIQELEQFGIPARLLPPTVAGRHLAKRAAEHTNAEWLWVWSSASPADRTFVIDCVVTALAAGAVAVKQRSDEGEGENELMLEQEPNFIARRAATSIPDGLHGSTVNWWKGVAVEWLDDAG